MTRLITTLWNINNYLSKFSVTALWNNNSSLTKFSATAHWNINNSHVSISVTILLNIHNFLKHSQLSETLIYLYQGSLDHPQISDNVIRHNVKIIVYVPESIIRGMWAFQSVGIQISSNALWNTHNSLSIIFWFLIPVAVFSNLYILYREVNNVYVYYLFCEYKCYW